MVFFRLAAEFRGPGVHHNFDDSDSGYDIEPDRTNSFGVGGYNGRIILLGDGSEVQTDSNDTEMFDREDKDLDSQVSKASTSSEGDDRGAVEEAESKEAVQAVQAKEGGETTDAARPVAAATTAGTEKQATPEKKS